MPIAILGLHSLTNHKHQICISKDQNHVHEKDLDCSLHLFKQSNTYIESFDYQLFENNEISKTDTEKYSFLINHQQLSFSLRGPPHSIFS